MIKEGHDLVALYQVLGQRIQTAEQLDELIAKSAYMHKILTLPTTAEELLDAAAKTPFQHATICEGELVRRLFGIANKRDPEEYGKLGYRLPPEFVPMIHMPSDTVWIVNYRSKQPRQ